MMIQRPAWVHPKAWAAMDFVNERYFNCAVNRGAGTSSNGRGQSILTSGSNNVAGVNYQLDTRTGLYVPQATSASMRIVPGTGLYIEGDTTNTCLWNRDFTNAVWVKTGMTAAKDQVGVDGVSNVASSLLATAPDATAMQTLATSTSGFRVWSLFLKRLVGTGQVWLTVDNGATWTDITAQFSSGVYSRPYITQTSVDPVVGIKLSVSGDKVAVDFGQQEKQNATVGPLIPTSPQLVTTTQTTRLNAGGTEEAFHDSPGSNRNDGIRWINNVIRQQPCGFACEMSSNAPAGATMLVHGSDAGGYFVTGGANGANFAGIAALAGAGVPGITNFNKMAFFIDGAGTRAAINGVYGTAATKYSTSAFLGTHGGAGDRGAGDNPISGIYRNLQIFGQGVSMSDGEILELSR